MRTEANYKPLKVLNASAGSGKTYQLVQEYIRLMIEDEKQVDTFSRMIAMTFTNKAALEMKERILSALDSIAASDHTLQLPLVDDLGSSIGISVEEVRSRARKSLKRLLHQYEDFHVMTIDKFNLRLIKSFGRDLDLPSDFEVVLDETELIEQIVDELFLQLGEVGNKQLNQLIFRYARKKLDEGSSWNFRNDLIQFGKILNSEKNNSVVEQLLIMDFSVEQFGQLHGYLKKIDAEFNLRAESVRKLLDSIADPKMLPGGGHTVNDIKSVSRHEQFPVTNELIKSRLAKNLQAEGPKEIPAGLKNAVFQLQEYWEKELQEYTTVQLFLKNFFNMALLQYMAGALKRIKKEEQLIRISEFNTLISELIQNENAPFIYERLGTRFHHFLLDEFQDTSRLQWLNMVPLIHNSIAQNQENLVVGDPKQSIYRFKNGVAEQFVCLPAIYNPEQDRQIGSYSQYFSQMGEVTPLENNWRSSPAIVHLNNAFFESMRSLLPEHSQSFYNSVSQHPKSTKNARIFIRSCPEKTTESQRISLLLEWIEECINDGFEAGGICILGGTNKVCNTWAIGLTDAGYKVVSSDSLLIHSNLHVQFAMAYLSRRLKPGGENEKKRFAELYFRIHHPSYQDYRKYIREVETPNGSTRRFFDDESFLKDHFDGYDRFFFKYENLYDLLEGFFRMMNYKELSNPYLHHLADLAFEFSQKKGPDLKAFIDYYENKKHQLALEVPESRDAIKIMTIHKSKGLEFPVVLLPSMEFGLDIKSNLLIDTGDHVVYKRPSKEEVLPALADAYQTEKDQILTDSVNLCYVAMTRPVERLYVDNHFEKTKFGVFFHRTLEQLEGITQDEETLIFDHHDGPRTIPTEKTTDSGIFLPTDIGDLLWFPHISLQDEEELQDSDYLSVEVQFGVQFHWVISKAKSDDEVSEVIAEGIRQGILSEENKDLLSKRASELFAHPEYLELLTENQEILYEQDFIAGPNQLVRPDQIILKADETIVLDFKTGMPDPRDEKQVASYCAILKEMDYPQVKGYLFYTSEQRLLQIA